MFFQYIFSFTDHQLCYVHLLRNVKRNLTKSDAKNLNSQLKKLRYENDFEVAFDKICKTYERKYSHFINGLRKNSRHYFQFLKYPESVGGHKYTTNPLESFNSILETLRMKNGGQYDSRRSVEISIYIIRDRLKWSKRETIIKMVG